VARKQDDRVLNLGFTDQSVWLRTSLTIPEPLTRQWYLVIPYPLLEEVDLYIVRDGQEPAIYHTSRQEAENRREQTHSYQVALPLPRDLSGQVDLFLRARSATALQVPVELWREDRLLIQFSLESLYWGAYFGVLCALGDLQPVPVSLPSGFGLRLLRAVHRLNQPSDALYLRTRERLDLGRAAVGAPVMPCPSAPHLRLCLA